MRRLDVALLWLRWRVLPSRALGFLGTLLGTTLYGLLGKRRRIAAINLRWCFPDGDEARRRRIARVYFRACTEPAQALVLSKAPCYE